ncbi:MAG: tRNA (guanosine(37)-N1)-methyltransferase TrmD [Myxococcales bacterium]|nr:tRNA (guanosine(37)-N1)-methyltransferase TrmD [Myxococcales bacterium]
MSDAASCRLCFEVLTLFPDAIEGFVSAGLLGKAIEQGRVRVCCTDFRDFTHDRHRTVDDAPFGGGAGMVIKPDPVVEAMEQVERERGPFHRILLTPSAPRFDQRVAARLAALPRVGLLCGRYEGIDDRVREHYVDECLSLGDFVLGGGEVAALVIIEAISRLVEGVVGNPESVDADSFGREGELQLLEHPHYTRPARFRGHEVPPVLLGGDHGAIAAWRREAALRRTWALRPELRPTRRLAADHPVLLAVSPEARPEAAALAELVREQGVELAVVGAEAEALPAWLEATAGRIKLAVIADARALRRRLRRASAGAEPRLARVVEPTDDALAGAPSRADRPEILLDLLVGGDGEAPLGPLVLWLGPGDPPSGLPVHAIYAPRADDLTRRGLAKADAIDDSSRPRSRMAALAEAALTGLRDRE